MTIQQLIAEGKAALEQAGISESDANAEHLAAFILNYESRSELRANSKCEPTPQQIDRYRALITRRTQHEPLQYILGEWDFYDFTLRITPDVLIPRPETEIVFEHALAETGTFAEGSTLLDIGTGSGAIAIGLALHCSAGTVYAMDSSEAALRVARGNGKRYHLSNLHFFQADVFEDKWLTTFEGRIDLLVSNPPYVSVNDFDTLEPELRLFEPRQALTDNATGLSFYERIAAIAPRLLSKNGRLVFELGYGQAENVTKIVESAGLKILRIGRDLAEIERVLVATRS